MNNDGVKVNRAIWIRLTYNNGKTKVIATWDSGTMDGLFRLHGVSKIECVSIIETIPEGFYGRPCLHLDAHQTLAYLDLSDDMTFDGWGADNQSVRAYTLDGSDYHSSLHTRSDFGCVEHEIVPREPAIKENP